MEEKEVVLSVKDLKINFSTDHGYVQAVRGVSFDLYKGETLCIVGESGSGKSVTNKAIMGILSANGRVMGGSIMYEGEDLTKVSEDEFHRIRGHKIGMIFQDPLSSLNPIVHIGKQITEAMLLKNKEKRKRGRKEFNICLKELNDYTSKALALEGADEKAIADYQAKCKEFDNFNIAGLEMQNPYNLAHGRLNDLVSEIEDLVFLYEHKRKVNLANSCAAIVKHMKLIKDPYLVREEASKKMMEYEQYLQNAIKQLRDKKIDHTEIKKEVIAKLKEIEGFAADLAKQESPNFFRFGFHKLHYGEEDLIKMSVEEANEKCLAELDKEFMVNFIAQSTKGVALSYKESLDGKKAAIAYLEEGQKLFADNTFTKEAANEYVSRAKEAINPSINVLALTKDTVAMTFAGALKDFVKKYFKAIVENEKDKKRYEKQTAKRDALIARGKKVEWKVVPLKNIDLNDIRQDILSLINRLHDNYVSFVETTKESTAVDFHEECVALIDQFKQHASDAVYRLTKREAKEKAIKLMEEVGIPEARIRFKQYPFEFSGGMRQRIVIAIALSADPDILICDEPTTALDVTIQAQILELINKIKEERKLSVIFITHDLGVVANMADEIAVMYAGKIVEIGTSEEIFYSPAHPYTWALLSSMPDLDTKEKLEAIPGTPPNMIYPPKGDAFAARNKYALKIDFASFL